MVARDFQSLVNDLQPLTAFCPEGAKVSRQVALAPVSQTAPQPPLALKGRHEAGIDIINVSDD